MTDKKSTECHWSQDGDVSDVWATQCGHYFAICSAAFVASRWSRFASRMRMSDTNKPAHADDLPEPHVTARGVLPACGCCGAAT